MDLWICLLHHFHHVDVFPNPFILLILFQCAFLMQLLIRNLRHQPVMQFLDKSRNQQKICHREGRDILIARSIPTSVLASWPRTRQYEWSLLIEHMPLQLAIAHWI